MMNAELAADLLERGAKILEAEHASSGRVNLHSARAVGDASVLLGLMDIANRCERFLRDASPQSFWEGVVTNIAIDRENVSNNARSLTPVIRIAENHPQISADYPRSVLVPEMGDHIGACGSRAYDIAFNNAGPNEFVWHEVVVAQAINGDLNIAIPKLDDINNQTLRRHVLLVFAIESFRRDDTIRGKEMLSLLERGGIDESTACHLALGITNHVPWQCYPFADY